MSDSRSVVIERDFAHPPEKLWRALTQPHLIAEWLMKNDFALAVGHRFQLQGEWGGTLDCEVLVVEANRVLSYSWNFDYDDPALRLRSIVTFTLTKSAAGTRLRVEQAGFLPEQKRAYGGARAGWERMLAQLEQVVDHLK
jgi:uncharacterized protein YndB with AHSA1/START domain